MRRSSDVAATAQALKRTSPGLYDGPRVRAEKTGERWTADIRMRDCGEPLGVETGYFEGSEHGVWMRVGTFGRLRDCEAACDRLYSGTHVFRPPHRNSSGPVPGLFVPFADVQDAIAAAAAPSP